MSNTIHKSLTTDYIKDYIHLTHEYYPQFFTRINATYYSLNVEASNFDPEFRDTYKQVDSIEHGGRYDVIYNVPVYIVSNNVLSENASEKGITTVDSTEINCIIDPLINLIPKDRDLISFRLGIDNDIVYTITNIELSSTLIRSYNKINIKAVPTLTIEKMKRFIISQNAFINEYHYIFEQREVFTIIKFQNLIKDYITYFNSIYDIKSDAHITNDKKIYLEFERAFNNLIEKYSKHLSSLKIDKSYLCDNLDISYDKINLFDYMLDNKNYINLLDNELNKESIYYITTIIKRLDKTRRRMINNKVKIYKLLDLDNKEDERLFNYYKEYISIFPLSLINNSIADWEEFVKSSFLENVKDSMDRALNAKFTINPNNMFENAIRLAQLLYILDTLIDSKIKSRITNITSYPMTNIN